MKRLKLTPEVRDERIKTLEASLLRLDDVDPEEIDADEYGTILLELVRLREERDGPQPKGPHQ